MSEIYMAMAKGMECNWPMIGFTVEADAHALVKACNEYQTTRPAGPGFAKLTDDEFDAAIAVLRAWADTHPGGEAADLAESFYVSTLEVRGPTP